MFVYIRYVCGGEAVHAYVLCMYVYNACVYMCSALP